MVKALRYSLKIFLSKPSISLIIAFEMFLLVAGANFALGQHNSRTMLYEPVQDHIERQGFFITLPAIAKVRDGEDTANAKLPTFEDVKALLGDVEILTMKSCTVGQISVTVIPDDMFDKLRLPLDKGSIFDRNNPSDNVRIIISSNENGYKYRDKITCAQQYIDMDGNLVVVGDDVTLEVAAQLSDPTYIPHFSYGIDMSYEYMYLPVDSDYYHGQLFCYTCESEIAKSDIANNAVTAESQAIISFTREVSDEEFRSAKVKLNELGITTLDNSVICENSQKILSRSFKKLLPAVFAFGMVVLIGIVSCSVIGEKSMLKNLAVFYCCGATKRDCILISIGQTLIISVIAWLTSALTLEWFILSKLSNKVGFVFRSSNVIMTIGIFAFCILISAIAPTVMISKADPRELLTDTANE